RTVREPPASGRLVVYLMKDGAHPIGGFQPADGPFVSEPQPLYGMDVKTLTAGADVTIDDSADSFPVKLSQLPRGKYTAQAVLDLHRQHARWEYEAGNLNSDAVPFDVPTSQPVRLPLAHVVHERPWPRANDVELVEVH